ncbi:hypothetical protein [Streptomyces sp. NPDC059538]|uniref:hypothetical protein n=1 Tax=Streptomyces sp. NPDC059538 TaxID=3346860 RepID=UPI0036C6C143
MASDLTEGGHAEAHCAPQTSRLSIELGQLALGAGKAHVKSVDLAEPSFSFSLRDAGDQVVANLDETGSLCWVRLEH